MPIYNVGEKNSKEEIRKKMVQCWRLAIKPCPKGCWMRGLFKISQVYIDDGRAQKIYDNPNMCIHGCLPSTKWKEEQQRKNILNH